MTFRSSRGGCSPCRAWASLTAHESGRISTEGRGSPHGDVRGGNLQKRLVMLAALALIATGCEQRPNSVQAPPQSASAPQSTAQFELNPGCPLGAQALLGIAVTEYTCKPSSITVPRGPVGTPESVSDGLQGCVSPNANRAREGFPCPALGRDRFGEGLLLIRRVSDVQSGWLASGRPPIRSCRV